MSRISWDETQKRIFETGIDRGVLYVRNSNGEYLHGVPWNGLISVSENHTGGEPEAIYSDYIKYLIVPSVEELEGSIEAYTFPHEWLKCDGRSEVESGIYVGQQRRSVFGLSYRTLIGNDTDNTDYGYKIHLIYGCLASPSEKTYRTVNDSPEAIMFSWDFYTAPVEITGYLPISEMVIDSTKIDATILSLLEDILYGTDVAESSLPYPDDIIRIIQMAAVWYNSRNGDLVIDTDQIDADYDTTDGSLTIENGHYAYNSVDDNPVNGRLAGNLESY